MAQWHLAYRGDAIPGMLGWLVDLSVRTIIFIVPVTLVAYWCDVQPSWKLFAFVGFWSFWSSVVSGAKQDSARQDERQSMIERKVAVLTPAQVAIEARKPARALPVPSGIRPESDISC